MMSLKVLADVVAELKAQNDRLGEWNHHDYKWLAIATEELGESSQAILHDDFGGDHAGTLRTELVQLAAVVCAWVECIDRRGE